MENNITAEQLYDSMIGGKYDNISAVMRSALVEYAKTYAEHLLKAYAQERIDHTDSGVYMYLSKSQVDEFIADSHGEILTSK